jgi:hypothetical protein
MEMYGQWRRNDDICGCQLCRMSQRLMRDKAMIIRSETRTNVDGVVGEGASDRNRAKVHGQRGFAIVV